VIFKKEEKENTGNDKKENKKRKSMAWSAGVLGRNRRCREYR
jgi:hypothetical protein